MVLFMFTQVTIKPGREPPLTVSMLVMWSQSLEEATHYSLMC